MPNTDALGWWLADLLRDLLRLNNQMSYKLDFKFTLINMFEIP